MNDRFDEYESPLTTRYASDGMKRLFSARHRIRTWRRLWLWLAEAQHELGLEITQEQVAALRDGQDRIDFAAAARYEARFRHDVVAHIHAFGDVAPAARGVIHLGATSCYVTDNADAIIQREALGRIELGLANTIAALADLAERTKGQACLAYTHFQPAQPTTLGKRVCLWLQDFLADLAAVRALTMRVPFLGSKGTTGTMASFLALFDGDAQRCERLDTLLAKKAGFQESVAVAGQTYPRRSDYDVVSTLGGIGVGVTRMANDIRLLSGLREVAEPFEQEQVGSSAMAYKQNPMRSERMTALARHLLALVPEAAQTAAGQWLERTLDDSASRRIFLPEAFLATDAILRLATNVARGMHVNVAVMESRLIRELPFMATEEILMLAVKAGGDRQVLHERIRRHSLSAKEAVLAGAARNDLMDRLAADSAFAKIADQLAGLMAPARFTGLATRQTERFLAERVRPALTPYAGRLGEAAEIDL